MNNIRYENNKFKFGTNCALCVACSFNCPKDAVSIGLLNGWRINGTYNIQKKASDPQIKFPVFNEELKGIRHWLYYKYYRNADRLLSENGISLSECQNNLHNPL